MYHSSKNISPLWRTMYPKCFVWPYVRNINTVYAVFHNKLPTLHLFEYCMSVSLHLVQCNKAELHFKKCIRTLMHWNTFVCSLKQILCHACTIYDKKHAIANMNNIYSFRDVYKNWSTNEMTNKSKSEKLFNFVVR